MLQRTFSANTSYQVKSVLDDMVSKIVKQQRRVTWSPSGITSVRTFIPEPWRKMWRKPVSEIRNANIEAAVPFTLPSEILRCEPILDDPILYEPKQVFCNMVPLPRSTYVSLDEIYKIAQELSKIDNMEIFVEKTCPELHHGVQKN